MIKAEEINRWIENANSFCYKRERCKGCPLVGEAEGGEYCRWQDGEMTQEEVDMIAAYAPPVDWSKVPIDTKVLVRDTVSQLWLRMHFAGFNNGLVEAWASGTTSWTSAGMKNQWKYGRLAEDDDR